MQNVVGGSIRVITDKVVLKGIKCWSPSKLEHFRTLTDKFIFSFSLCNRF